MKVSDVIKKIDQIAVESPEKIAYDYLGETNTYGELKTMSDGLASEISGMNLSDAPIMVYGAQTFEMIATFLGIVKSGRAYIPVDQHSPAERLTMINEIAHPAACVAVEDLPISLGEELPVIENSQLTNAFKNGNTVNEDNFVSGDDDFYIIFTSGTTGLPKGVEISHDNLLSFVNWEVSDFSLPENPVTLSQPPYSFDLSVMDLYPTLVMGGTLKAVPKQVTDNFKQLFEVLPTLNLNVWVSTPSFMDICLLQPTFDAEHMPSLTSFLFCGEELTHSTAATLKKRFPNAKIFNTYGPTEATVAVTSIEITDQVLEKYDRLPIGHAKSDTLVYVIDDGGSPVEAGTEGELIISGPSVSKGYLNNPEKTANAFFDHDGHAAYHTGDLVVMDEDEMVFYRGRTDFQIKLHGYRIELEEVNHHLSNAKLIKQGVAVPKYDKDHKVSQLIAYVVPEENDFESQIKLTVAIKEGLKEDMMEYMIPNRFIFVDSLPQTANGKIDIKTVISEANK
ncbi:D-alanine--poly(phosphoribitol) ligase subunit DltA [Pediococcus claussenii]|uniref:D-alanine--D-alanyl carrier protein ligase n=1 Tax=Pediococcus claussenii (strain ATCC BAA-344 / DSM 14800 / JCM 18046 / KCTC 3811 / LMG 21948 / P06) TaxID=701521 RepID=G8PA77_PEDCP|nr:D-alanine--poly(phosphoribitol) ligase subunit DltA [Pediococcus claussenii]AEV94516.1 D-alanine--poly(phosphoribitol) ligase, subunit 1 [Pediococcus claussenii ATCC BAA-344]ANZ69734.1 D-alanine--poly(phosphoribitol) ligase [Pediococcus claussenii]ANZ71551.1 D-alanine--poly(phosphoribitol) ligase [Pediococcus claussenii]KRN19777.1 dltA protein [Pediococcus claussenii]